MLAPEGTGMRPGRRIRNGNAERRARCERGKSRRPNSTNTKHSAIFNAQDQSARSLRRLDFALLSAGPAGVRTSRLLSKRAIIRLDGGLAVDAPRPRSFGELAQSQDVRVCGGPPGQNQPQRHEREIRSASPQHRQPLVKGSRGIAAGPIFQQNFYDLLLGRRAVEKVPVEQIEPHFMAFAATAALSQLLTHMRAVDGGLYAASLVSTSEHLVDGAPATVRTRVQGLRYSLDQCTGQVCLGTYFDGERLFSVNINGTALPTSTSPETALRALRIVGTLKFLDPQFGAEGGEIFDEGTAPFEGLTMRKIVVDDAIARPMILYIDPQTWLVAGAEDINGDAVYTMLDYRKVGTFMLPFEIERNGEVLERYETRAVSPQPLQAPHGLSVVLHGPAPAMPLDPLSISPLGTCSIGGRNVSCLIDSGNSAMSMSLELAEQLGLTPVGMLRVAGLGDYATEVVRAGKLHMGDAEFGPANYIVLNDIHRYGYDIVVGADVLASVRLTIDAAHHRILFGNAGPPGGGVAVPLAFENFIPVVNVTLGDQPTSLAIDTGDQSNINLGYEYYLSHSSLFQATKSANVSGIGGDSVEMLGEIAMIRIGALTAEHQQIGTTKILKGTADGHLGAGFLSKYRVVLDYAHAVMRLLPPQR